MESYWDWLILIGVEMLSHLKPLHTLLLDSSLSGTDKAVEILK